MIRERKRPRVGGGFTLAYQVYECKDGKKIYRGTRYTKEAARKLDDSFKRNAPAEIVIADTPENRLLRMAWGTQ